MADRIPLIVHPGANQIQETPVNDRLIVGLTTITASSLGNAGNAGINQTGVITATTFNATSSFTGPGATFGNITIAVVNDQTIATTSGDLVIDPNQNTDINSDVDVSGSFKCSATSGTILMIESTLDTSSKTTGSGTFKGGVGIDKKLHVGDGILCDNDITAFASDIRLKTNIEPLNNALDKVSSLNGFTYQFNETGGSLGFNTNISYVGVSAQEVQEVLPEAVKPAPADNNYYTVQYEKLVPLLIEAIKELKAEVEELKTHTH